MKKRVFIFLVIILSLTMILSGCTSNKSALEVAQGETTNFVQGTKPFETLTEFVKSYPNRTAGYVELNGENGYVDYSYNAVNWISEQLLEMGYSPSYEEPLQEFYYSNPFTNKNEKGYNAIFKKESASDKKVVIGAHYDNVASLAVDGKILGGDGTYSSGVGIATLIETARVLKDKNLPFDVEFVAFGASEVGGFGSMKYLESQNKKENILLMIDFDRNAIGDYVYMYSSEAKTKHNNFFYDIAKQNQLYIKELPKYMSPALIATSAGNGIYVNEAMYAESDLFLKEGINIINFISMNFSAKGGVCENEGSADILYTVNDNLDNVILRCGGDSVAQEVISRQINSAISTVVYAFENENFVNVMQESKANGGKDWMLNVATVSYIAYGILGGLILILFVLYFSLRKKTKQHDVYINTMYGRVNAKTGQFVNQNNEPINDDKVASEFEKIFKDFQETGRVNNHNSNDNKDGDNINNNTNDKDKDIFGDY